MTCMTNFALLRDTFSSCCNFYLLIASLSQLILIHLYVLFSILNPMNDIHTSKDHIDMTYQQTT